MPMYPYPGASENAPSADNAAFGGSQERVPPAMAAASEPMPKGMFDSPYRAGAWQEPGEPGEGLPNWGGGESVETVQSLNVPPPPAARPVTE